MKLRASLLVLFAALCLPVHALAASVVAEIDKPRASVNDQVRLKIKIIDAQGNVQAPRMTGIPGFEIFYTGRASHLTFINNQSSSSIEFSYVLVPQKEGDFTINPIPVQVDGQTLMTSPLLINVSGTIPRPQAAPQTNPFQGFPPPQTNSPTGSAGTAPIQNEPAPAFAPNQDENIYVLATPDLQTVYPNQQITLVYSLYTRYDTRYEGFEKEPEFSGFWIEDFPMEKEIKRDYVNVNGKRFLKADIKKIALFPTAPADYKIQPGVIKASIRKNPEQNTVFDEFFNDNFFSGGSFFSRRENLLLSPSLINIKVIPFPENGKPKSFKGAVGNFRMTATLDRKVVKQDEPVTLKMVIEGSGNIETLTRPETPDLKDFKIYESDASSQLFRNGDIIGGQKTFELVFIPLRPGQIKIPALEFSYFHPTSRSYQRLFTPEFMLDVEKAESLDNMQVPISQKEEFKKEIQAEGKDIRFIRERFDGGKSHKTLYVANITLFVMNGVMALLALGLFLAQRSEEKLSKNAALKRKRYAKSRAQQKMRKLQKMKDPSESAYFEELERILTQYFADKFNLSPHGVTRQELEVRLMEVLGHEGLYQEIMNLYQWCEESRFARAQLSKSDKMKAHKILQDAINRFERMN